MPAVAGVSRADYLPEELKPLAEIDEGVHIGDGIVVPPWSVVDLMVGLLDLKPTDIVYEVGLGSGFQAAVLAQLCREVHAVDIRPFPDSVRQLPENVYIRKGDGRLGPDQPVDAILVSCGTEQIWPRWKLMLKEGGRLVVPFGPATGQAIRKYVKVGCELVDCCDYAYATFVQLETGK